MVSTLRGRPRRIWTLIELHQISRRIDDCKKVCSPSNWSDLLTFYKFRVYSTLFLYSTYGSYKYALNRLWKEIDLFTFIYWELGGWTHCRVAVSSTGQISAKSVKSCNPKISCFQLFSLVDSSLNVYILVWSSF